MSHVLLGFINQIPKDERPEFEREVGTTLNYMRRAISAGIELNPKVSTRIEVVTGGKVTRKDLRPNDWHEIWPELAE